MGIVADVVRESVHAAVLLAVTAVVAVVMGQPFLFPSLGPSAYVLATVDDGGRTDPRRVVGGHAIGVVAGLVAYHTLGLLPTVRDGAVILLAAGCLVVAHTSLQALDGRLGTATAVRR